MTSTEIRNHWTKNSDSIKKGRGGTCYAFGVLTWHDTRLCMLKRLIMKMSPRASLPERCHVLCMCFPPHQPPSRHHCFWFDLSLLELVLLAKIAVCAMWVPFSEGKAKGQAKNAIDVRYVLDDESKWSCNVEMNKKERREWRRNIRRNEITKQINNSISLSALLEVIPKTFFVADTILFYFMSLMLWWISVSNVLRSCFCSWKQWRKKEDNR